MFQITSLWFFFLACLVGGANLFETIEENAFVASSSFNKSTSAYSSRLDIEHRVETEAEIEDEGTQVKEVERSNSFGWLQKHASTNDWVQVDLDRPKFIKYVTLVPGQGDAGDGVYLVLYKLGCSLDGRKFTTFTSSNGSELLITGQPGHSKTHNVRLHLCRFVRVYPLELANRVSLQWKLDECQRTYISNIYFFC